MTDKVVSAGNSEYQYYVNSGKDGHRQRLYLTRIHRASGTKYKVRINQTDLQRISEIFTVIESVLVDKKNKTDD